MQKKIIIVRYGEVGLKSPQTRKTMEERLVKNIKKSLGERITKREPGRIFVEPKSDNDAYKISRIFGVVSTSPALKKTSHLGGMIKAAAEYSRKRIDQKESFAVRIRRKGDHDYSSMEVAAKLGSIIEKETGAGVDLEKPDHTIYIEIRDKNAYIFDQMIRGVGGLPLGTQGKAIALISGGIDSPVAAWLLMKRGVEIIPLFMDCRPLVDDRTFERVIETLKCLSSWANHSFWTYVVPYGDALLDFLKYGDKKLGCVLCKRMMYLVGQGIAEREGAISLVTGESLGQVASQTLQNLNTLSKGMDIPILRPLIGFDKTEIVELSKKIGAYEASIRPANCCLGPPIHPEIKCKAEILSKAESDLDMKSLVDKALSESKKIEVGDGKG